MNLERVGQEQRSLHISDVHWDSKFCDRELLTTHLNQALEYKAPIFIYGDLFDLMQGKFDRRKKYKEMRPDILEYMLQHDCEYLDAVIEQAGEWFKPWAKNIVLVTEGNHEYDVSEKNETDILNRFVERLRINGSNARRGPWWGFVLLMAESCKKTNTRVVCYHHGYGGGGEVTRGLIDNNRTRGQYFAHFFFSGHIHRQNYDKNKITQVNTNSGKVESITQRFLRIPGYKQEHEGGWHCKTGKARRPVGGWWLRTILEGVTHNRESMMWGWKPEETNGDDE